MSVTIHQSVGLRGRNDAADVEAIQGLLNAVPQAAGGPLSRLAVNGRCDGSENDPTVVAIKKFQWRHSRMPGGGAAHLPDGRIDPGGYALRRLNAFSPGPGPLPATPAGPRGGPNLPLRFGEMWQQIEANRGFTATYQDGGQAASRVIAAGNLAPTELWMAIFWEESNFRNKRGVPSHRGGIPLGFGQVMNTNVQLLNHAYGTDFSDQAILGDSNLSIRLAMLALGEHWRTSNNLHLALSGYAHGQDEIVGKWETCARALQGLALHAGGLGQLTDMVGVRIREILWAARNGTRGCTPDLAFD